LGEHLSKFLVFFLLDIKYQISKDSGFAPQHPNILLNEISKNFLAKMKICKIDTWSIPAWSRAWRGPAGPGYPFLLEYLK
jgi:hypothetical protein